MVAVEWSNGVVDHARDWDALLLVVMGAQWGQKWHELDEDKFRFEMAKRALRWSGTKIDIGAPAREFFRELERARMLIVVQDVDTLYDEKEGH